VEKCLNDIAESGSVGASIPEFTQADIGSVLTVSESHPKMDLVPEQTITHFGEDAYSGFDIDEVLRVIYPSVTITDDNRTDLAIGAAKESRIFVTINNIEYHVTKFDVNGNGEWVMTVTSLLYLYDNGVVSVGSLMPDLPCPICVYTYDLDTTIPILTWAAQ
jgi:hypothetical protein